MDVRTPPIRFGMFEADLSSGELRREGVKIKLQEQPFQILAALLERPREVVTREDLQKRLWPSDVVVDFDRGLNKAINRLREALVLLCYKRRTPQKGQPGSWWRM